MPSTNQSIVINASIEDVWDRLNNFHDFSWATNVITHVEKVGDIGGDKVGAKRILNNAFHETLIDINSTEKTLKYSIDDGPSPVSKNDVSDYVGTISLSAADGGETLVEWTSSWVSDEDEAVDFCHVIYVALLQALKTSFQ